MISSYLNYHWPALAIFLQCSSCRYICALILGLCLGSFINVVIYRLPIMQGYAPDHINIQNCKQTLSLMQPASFCPQCRLSLRWWMNLPLLSYIILRGRCHFCHTKISYLYPVVEIATTVLFLALAYNYHDAMHLISYSILLISLLALSIIDLKTMILPDILTIPLMWLGLIANLYGDLSGSLLLSVTGAIIGYLFLATIYWLFKLFTKKDGLGFGDFKLMAAIGAWLGNQYIIPVALISSSFAILYAVVNFLLLKKNMREAIPFGPFLSLAAVCCLLFNHFVQPVLLWS